MILIGIDPGVTGALSLITPHGLQAVADMPVMVRSETRVKAKAGGMRTKVTNQVNGAELTRILREWCGEQDKNNVMVVIEKAQAMPGKVKGSEKAQMSSATFSIGLSAGIIEGVVAARGYPHMLVHPATWKAHFQLLGKDKNAARAKAQRFYPAAEIARVKDHNRAEAILLARYGVEKTA